MNRFREAPSLHSKIRLKTQPIGERRNAPRVSGPFPAVALDVAACRQSLGVRTVVDNLSAEGFYLRLAYSAREGESLLVITQFWQAVLLLRGKITRVEELKDGTFGIALSITKHQIFSSLVSTAKLETEAPWIAA